MKNTISIYGFSMLLIMLLISCTDDNESFNEKGELTAWVEESYLDINNTNRKNLNSIHFISNNKIMNTTETIFEENGDVAYTVEKDYTYENEILKSVQIFDNNSLDIKITYTYNSDSELIEKNLENLNNEKSYYEKTLYVHNNNSVTITELISSDGVDYKPSNYILSANLNFDLNDNLIRREILFKGFFSKQDEIEITDFTYNSNSNLIEMTNEIEYCTYSTINNPVELINTSTFGKKNFQLLHYFKISPEIGYNSSKNVLATFKPGINYDVEIANTLNSNELLSKITLIKTFSGPDNVFIDLAFKATHEFIYN